jgi:hypothetical protein
METGGSVMNGPPKWIELLVELMTPPACREHVLGDLRERYPGRGYLRGAAAALTLVIASRIRRTTQSRLLALEIGAFATAFCAAAVGALPYIEPILWRVLIPIVTGLAGLRIAAAYTPKPLVQIFTAFAAMLAAQAVFPGLPRGMFLTGAMWSVLLIATVRTLMPEPEPGASTCVEQLRARALVYEKSVRRRNYREQCAAALVAAFFAWEMLAGASSVPFYGPAAMIAVSLYVMVQLHRAAGPRPTPDAAPLPQLLDHYREELVRQREWHRRAWSRKLSPLTAALTLFLAGAVAADPRFLTRLPLFAGPLLLLILIAWKWNRNLAGRLDGEIQRVESARGRL